MADFGSRPLSVGRGMGEAAPEMMGPKIETNAPRPGDFDDDSDWEYEYSATETETYYLTVDLSTPDFTARNDDQIVHNTRGGYRTWFNPLSEKPDISAMFGEGGDNEGQVAKSSVEPSSNQRASNSQGQGNDEEEDDNSEDDDDEDEDDADEGRRENTDPQLSGAAGVGSDGGSGKGSGVGISRPAKRKKKTKKEDKPLQIQIMDLHSEQPIISHKGMVFKGCWSRNIGTELVFTTPLKDDGTTNVDLDHSRAIDHDQENLAPEFRETRKGSDTASLSGHMSSDKTLPYLAAVPGATLLAASSARLQCQPISIQNRALPEQRTEAHRLARSANNFVIHITDDLTGSRKPQGRFLEQLMAIKRKRGETDEVTVVTAENPDDAVDDDSEEDFEREKKERKKLDGQARLMRKKMDPQTKGPGRGVGYKPRIRRNKAGARRRKEEAAALSSGGPSTPTPASWPQGYEQPSMTGDPGPSETLSG
ncbi:hypothetical protein MGG_00252 [Pyricularia oryzae 70-15]|uniref:Transcription factor TFIIIC triple barrel domain-containing protein n=2 Tax=Pyricularia oryzae TaxID=318829 RepID=G4NDI5_PYRO7|nr:uncharacterized protein MGG_00252 [Pyricularia oryzae 70-15]EHA49270.1 hypothetical protein MGG_00252 [Pyricularia oryzae 70-15]ELQ36003.1 hypothetical protein OOU_Y34scaffold00672g21 [Pyricularia oryzae Y34]KAI7914887.1 hypothetical protein M9X92_008763 [Pyricularia oryzae]KAI7917491.1 hypothetical protein M0657_008081 [Pyricularia oryzae]